MCFYFTHSFLNRSTFHLDGPLIATPTNYTRFLFLMAKVCFPTSCIVIWIIETSFWIRDAFTYGCDMNISWKFGNRMFLYKVVHPIVHCLATILATEMNICSRSAPLLKLISVGVDFIYSFTTIAIIAAPLHSLV